VAFFAHFAQALPPQSFEVSAPFLTPSVHVPGAHCISALQIPVAQSMPAVQVRPAAQGAHDAPPQSTSDSVPFSWPSEQLMAMHREPTHLPLEQSVVTAQDAPLPHGGQPPPQSVSVSAPFFVRSVHVGAAHRLVPASRGGHASEWQSRA
jgi:hypothetical protein